MKKQRKRAPDDPPSKPVIPVPKPPPASAGPIFIARFADGKETRMTVYSGLDPLDLGRGIAVSKAAYSCRVGVPMSAIAVPIIEARFETKDGVLLAAYTAEQLESGSKKEDAA
jgi:hypothetical protein